MQVFYWVQIYSNAVSRLNLKLDHIETIASISWFLLCVNGIYGDIKKWFLILSHFYCVLNDIIFMVLGF